MADRVVEEVAEHLAQRPWICHDRYAVAGRGERKCVRLGTLLERRGPCVTGELERVDRVKLGPPVPGLDARQVEEVLDDVVQPLRIALDHVAKLPLRVQR